MCIACAGHVRGERFLARGRCETGRERIGASRACSTVASRATRGCRMLTLWVGWIGQWRGRTRIRRGCAIGTIMCEMSMPVAAQSSANWCESANT
eukprot:5294930-Prymnesium_polylepis.1